MRMGAACAALALALLVTSSAEGAWSKDAYVGLVGAGASMTQPLGERFDWGLKAEAGYLARFTGASGQALVRFNVPDTPVFVQLSAGALYSVGSSSGLKPWGSLGFGAKVDKWSILLQLPGFPIIGLSFPL